MCPSIHAARDARYVSSYGLHVYDRTRRADLLSRLSRARAHAGPWLPPFSRVRSGQTPVRSMNQPAYARGQVFFLAYQNANYLALVGLQRLEIADGLPGGECGEAV